VSVPNQPLPPVVSPAELAAVLAARPDVRLLDVRTPGEFAALHITGAYNVPLDTLGEHGPEIRAAVRQPVVLVCQSGQRARRAERVLADAGMPNLHVLDGGVGAWAAMGGPVTRGAARPSLERQVRVAAGALVAVGGALALGIHAAFALLPLAVGGGLILAGLTDRCGLALLLTRLPGNRAATRDVGAMVAALKAGAPPLGARPTEAAACREGGR
jgi:rhodanese-related sulfurtransferase